MSDSISPSEAFRISYPLMVGAFLISGTAMLWPAERASLTADLLGVVSVAFLVAGLGLALRIRRLTLAFFERSETERSLGNSRLSRDEMTDALLRRAFMEAATAMATKRHGPQRSLMLVDIDHLKTLNDALGHQVGDAAIARLGAELRKTFPRALIGRLGGDEFCVLCEHDGENAFETHAEAMRVALRHPAPAAGQTIGVSISAGILHLPSNRVFLNEMLHHADLALYASKKGGRDRITVFTSDMLKDAQQRRFIERELRSAILLNELDVAYQPIVDGTGRVIAMEALVRWHHAVRGPIPPSDFVPVAEETTLIDLLGEWVLRRACRDAADFGDLKVGVNISANQIKRDLIEETVAAVLRDTGLAPSRLVLEITESAAIVLTPAMRQRLVRLTEMGVGIALDDFGTGYCGIGYLRAFPIRSLKIDRSFVSSLGRDKVDDAIVSAIIHVGRTM